MEENFFSEANVRIAIVDDQKRERDLLSEILKEYGTKRRYLMNIDTFSDGEQVLDGYTQYLFVVIFMDIFMPGMDGIEAARKIREKDADVSIVFVTTSTEHMPEAFDVHAFQYLVKDGDAAALREKVFRLMDELLARRIAAEKVFHFISERHEYALPFTELLCLESDGHYTVVTDKKGQRYRSRLSFSDAVDSLSGDRRFLSINRGILVNMDYIVSFDRGICTMLHELTLPVNVRKQKDIDQLRQNYVFQKLHEEMQRSAGSEEIVLGSEASTLWEESEKLSSEITNP